MSLLHTVNKSPFAAPTLDACLSRMAEGAALILIEDGVYAALADGPHAGKLAGRLRVYALRADLAARGLSERALIAGIGLIDYEGFVDLCVAASAVQSWL